MRVPRTLDSMVVNIVFVLSFSMRALDEFSVFVSRSEIRGREDSSRIIRPRGGEGKKLINFYDNPPTVSLFILHTVDTWQFR